MRYNDENGQVYCSSDIFVLSGAVYYLVAVNKKCKNVSEQSTLVG